MAVTRGEEIRLDRREMVGALDANRVTTPFAATRAQARGWLAKQRRAVLLNDCRGTNFGRLSRGTTRALKDIEVKLTSVMFRIQKIAVAVTLLWLP